ncbi:MAG: ABC transporter permease, partial [Planctomycetota bacterium]
MSLVRLVQRSLCFYWRTNLGVLLAAAASTAVLVGALVVGDSVRHSLRMMVTSRLGKTDLAILSGDRFFRGELADEVAAELGTATAPVLKLRGLTVNSDGTRRANRVEVLGVDERFYRVGTGDNPFGDGWTEGVVLNEPLAARLDVVVGDEIVLRVAKPGVMPRDIPLSPESDLSTAFRLTVTAVAGESEFGHFSLQANQVTPLNAFVSLTWLQEKLSRIGQANVLLVAAQTEDVIAGERASEAIARNWQLGDVGLEIRQLDGRRMLELRSRRIFIDESLSQAAISAGEGTVGVLTYFVNELSLGDKTTPYSIVTAADKSEAFRGIISADMKNDEIVINQWLADDLGAREGNVVELSYFVIGPMRKLLQQADVDNCRDWEPGIPIDLDKIRKRDEDYWHQYRGTPKAFVTLKAGQAMWANRYGDLSA